MAVLPSSTAGALDGDGLIRNISKHSKVISK